MSFEFSIPTRLIFGEGSISRAPEELKRKGSKKSLLVTDKGVKESGTLKLLEEPLQIERLNFSVFDKVVVNPSEAVVEEGVKQYRTENCDSIVAVGGGSSMDVAKAIGLKCMNPGMLRDYEGVERFPSPPQKIIAIPTTAGTGSEVSPAAVITSEGKRMLLRSHQLFPEIAILDPRTMVNLSFQIAAYTGMDALCHAIESYNTNLATEVTDAHAAFAIKLIGRFLRRFTANRRDSEAALKMQIASNFAGRAFTWARVAVAHAISIPLGARFNLPHGLTTALLLPHVMNFNLMSKPEKFCEIAGLLGGNVHHLPEMEGARISVVLVRDLLKDLKIPTKLADLGIKREDLKVIARDAFHSGFHAFNPRQMGKEDFEEIIREAL